ncbi:MAG: hypothetical protein EOP21_09725 [Hyphomicrobiales bacterium]|jgi:hypothetical protein|nr:MAG: hypothetical protein EOP21_09725 [Hyphomicrobiales bacterium]
MGTARLNEFEAFFAPVALRQQQRAAGEHGRGGNGQYGNRTHRYFSSRQHPRDCLLTEIQSKDSLRPT